MKAITYRDSLLKGAAPETKAKFEAVLKDVRGWGIPLIVWEVRRSRARQLALFLAGKTGMRYPKFHGKGMAMDCCFLINDKPSWNAPSEWWKKYGRAAKAHGLVWGGDWKIVDKPHVQLEEKKDV